jgi:tRNA(Ile)-lysidine synthase
VFSSPSSAAHSWPSRWGRLARAAGIERGERLLLALSGGADSVLLLHLLADAAPAPPLRAVHVDHGLRGEAARADARFCANLCRALGVPFTLRTLALDPEQPSLEARAREERYRVLLEEATRTGHRTVLTGHHADDALETLLWRWVRGTGLPGLRGPRSELIPRTGLGADPLDDALRVVRPLLPLRREEVRRLLSDRGLRWREDGSNADPRFTRTRVRHGFLPFLEGLLPDGEAVENLRAFGRAVESLEERLAGATARLAWAPAPYAAASRGPEQSELGGVLPRRDLMQLASPLRRRALWRLLTEGTGQAPGRSLLEAVLADLAHGTCTRHSLPDGWTLLMRSDELHLLPPRPAVATERAQAHQGTLPFPSGSPDEPPRADVVLAVPGIVTLSDGRRISAERLRPGAPTSSFGSTVEVELDALAIPHALRVRWPLAGDRFHPLGAPGSKPLRRFLADRGVPREERGSVPVVLADDEIVWVAGVEPAERHRLSPRTRERLRLTLHRGEPSQGRLR